MEKAITNIKEATYDIICILEQRGVQYLIDYICGDIYLVIDNTGYVMRIVDTLKQVQVRNDYVSFGEEEYIYFKTLTELDKWIESQPWGHKHIK